MKRMNRQQLQKWLQKRYDKNARQLSLDAEISTQSAYQVLKGDNLMRPENLSKLGVEVMYEVKE